MARGCRISTAGASQDIPQGHTTLGAADFGTHDYCLPCETNPSCTSSYQTKDEEPPKGGNDSQDKDRRD
ncbi:hypothetical protein TgHK011_001962 [Trichoderma gracile]|nr:hypothetical protein TgHK011_001962 [Trichoderma gracile]